jgi:hypothetical protein
VKGPTSFEDLRYNSIQPFPTFHAACLAQGLLEDDGEWDDCLAEASEMQTGARLQHLFTTILLFCAPSEPHRLWYRYRQYICNDLRHRLQILGLYHPSDDDVYDYSLHSIDRLLLESGHSLQDWPLMPTVQCQWEAYSVNTMIAEQLNYNRNTLRLFWDSHHPLLNQDQRDAYDRIIHSIESRNGEMFMIEDTEELGKHSYTR